MCVVEDGDTVIASIPDVSWGLEPPTSLTAPRMKVEPRDASGPCMLGPIAVQGAKPGETLQIDILSVRPASWAWTYSGKGMGNARLNSELGIDGELSLTRWAVDHHRRVLASDAGHEVPMRPFLGIMGVSPAETGPHSGWKPTAGGGNMDCRELVEGATLFLPVLTPGAMLSIGDGHAAQGDGEVAGTAAESLMEHVELRLRIRRDMTITQPRIRTVDSWITLGFAETLDDAARLAMTDMVELIAQSLHVSKHRALELASACVDVRVTQMVNPLKGAHAVIAASVIE